MDVHMKSNNRLQFGTNEATGHNPGDDELKFLSPEEKEILRFFEETIESLEQGPEEDESSPRIKSFKNLAHIDSASNSGPRLHTNPKEQDIIDLVRHKPDLVQTTPTSPGFQSLVPTPESHVQVKLHSDPVDPLPESHPVYHPPGSIPTPALIAQKIAENQTSGNTVLSASSLLRRRSSEFDKSTSSNKQGPPTSTKPARYPANINVILGNREQQNPSLSNINIEERRAQMLANLSGTSHPLVEEDPQVQAVRNTPTRSLSFRDPTPDISHREALSRLGLSRNRALSGDLPLPCTRTNMEKTELLEPRKEVSISPNVVPISTVKGPSTPPSRQPQEPSSPAAASTNIKLLETTPRSPLSSYRKTDTPPPDAHKSFETRYSPTPTYSQKDNFPPPPPPVETGGGAEFNSYGGKSILVNRSPSFKSELPPSPVSPEPSLSPILATPPEFNPYGGKSKVMTPIPAPVSRRDLPDILSSHIDKSQTLHSANASVALNSYGGKTRTINPSDSPSSRTLKPTAPTPAPRPPRHSYHGPTVAPKSPQRALSPEHTRRSGSLFRPQGITVQFSGKGASEESRREALRKLGLLKD